MVPPCNSTISRLIRHGLNGWIVALDTAPLLLLLLLLATRNDGQAIVRESKTRRSSGMGELANLGSALVDAKVAEQLPFTDTIRRNAASKWCERCVTRLLRRVASQLRVPGSEQAARIDEWMRVLKTPRPA
jgi:hypothetical protein